METVREVSGPIGGYEQNGRWKLDARFNRTELIARIRRVAAYRDRISVTRLDALELLTQLPKSERVLVYLDPPYFQKGQRLYLNSLTEDDHDNLASLLLDNPPFNWVLTYDNVPHIRNLYRSLRPRAFELSYSAYKRRIGREVLIIDPRLKVTTDLFKSHHRPGCLQFANLSR